MSLICLRKYETSLRFLRSTLDSLLACSLPCSNGTTIQLLSSGKASIAGSTRSFSVLICNTWVGLTVLKIATSISAPIYLMIMMVIMIMIMIVDYHQ